MKQKIIDKNSYPKKCANCFYGRSPLEKTSVLCERKGVVDPESRCRHYKYDPLKRVPAKPIMNMDFKPEDFAL